MGDAGVVPAAPALYNGIGMTEVLAGFAQPHNPGS